MDTMSNSTSLFNDTQAINRVMAEDVPPSPSTLSTDLATTTTHIPTTPYSDELSGGAIAGIVIGCVVGAILLLLTLFFAYRWIKERRKNHGEYKPHEEEEEHAKNLPYLTPPSIEGLI